MDDKLMSAGFVADAIIAYMRNENRPTDEEADFLDRMPMISALRERISESDIPWLLKVVEKESGPIAGLFCSLLRNHIHRQEVKICLESRWNTANLLLKNRLMWRMLDDPDLPGEWHRRFFDFVLADWNNFQDSGLKFYGGSQQALGNILSRLADPAFPSSKKWIYLCSAAGVVEDRNAAKAVVDSGRSMNDPFAREVAEILLKRFYSEDDK